MLVKNLHIHFSIGKSHSVTLILDFVSLTHNNYYIPHVTISMDDIKNLDHPHSLSSPSFMCDVAVIL